MLPPVGAYMPFIETWPEPGKPTQTAVARRGVKPTNQASMFLSVVPVLPPAGQPICARAAGAAVDVLLEDLGRLVGHAVLEGLDAVHAPAARELVAGRRAW